MRVGTGQMAARAMVALLFAASVALPAAAKPTRARRASHPGYRTHVAKWHAREPGATAPTDATGRPKLVLEAINLGERVELTALGDDGGFSDDDRARATRLFRDTRGEDEHAVAPDLLDRLYAIQRHFAAPCVRVVSAYRAPRGARTSEHGKGRAADIVVPGADDRAVAAYARTLGPSGVGLYPVSGFVHVDVRESSHYWVDWSGPGQRARIEHHRQKPRAPKKHKKKG